MDPLAELVGESPAIQAVRDQIRRLVARLEVGRRLPAILISGETGLGKGLVDSLLEAELFGFERGAFTNARRAKPGLFQAAHHGTIFLDEVGLLPVPLQAKLLKVLEEKAVRRLGATPRNRWTRGSSAPPTPISRERYASTCSARISITGWLC